jgi:outer membrane protein assembly factor BamB
MPPGRWLISVAVAALGLASPASAAQVSGTVFVDRDGDGVFSAGDEPVPGVAVFYETAVFAVTNAQGAYALAFPTDGIVWVRTPEGFSPEPSWRAVAVANGNVTVDLPLRPSAVAGPVVFVDAADSHLGITDANEAAFALTQASALSRPPHFVTVVGDITNNTDAAEFQAFLQARSGAMGDLPFVPVVGNHDWQDGGASYRHVFGPPMYSFDSGGVHFIVLEYAAPEAEQLAFIARDLALPRSGTLVAAFLHAPPYEPQASNLAAAGIDYLFTGHAHANRLIRHGTMIEVNTEPLIMGGIDYTPAGYRVVALEGNELRTAHHTLVNSPVLTLTFPPAQGTCIEAGEVPVIAAMELGPLTDGLELRVDGGPPMALPRSGGWTYAARVELGPGDHRLALSAAGITRTFRVCAAPPPVARAGPGPSWPQLGGSAGHLGYVGDPLPPPLHEVWAQPVGGHIFGGSPVVAGGSVIVPVVDLEDGRSGGVVAFDAVTGEKRWQALSGAAVRNAPAVHESSVVFASADGVVHAADLATGRSLWDVDIGAAGDLLSWLYAGPTIDDRGTVYIGGQRNLVALDAATGAVIWSHPVGQTVWAVTLASAAVGGGVGVTILGRGTDGVSGFDAGDGAALWSIAPPISTAIQASPVISADTVFLANLRSEVMALDLVTGQGRWATKLYDRGGDLRYGLVGTPALADGLLVVPSPVDRLFGLDVASGQIRWEVSCLSSVIRPLPYGRAGTAAFLAAPAIAQDVVWAAAADGFLRAIDVVGGEVLWFQDLGTPLLSGPVPAPPFLYVGAYDGTLHAFVTDSAVLPPERLAAGDGGQRGCGCTVGRAGGDARTRAGALGLAFLALLGARALRTRALRTPAGRRPGRHRQVTGAWPRAGRPLRPAPR